MGGGVLEETPGWFRNALKGYDWFNNDVARGENPIYRAEYSHNGGTLEAKGIAPNEAKLSRDLSNTELYDANRQLQKDFTWNNTTITYNGWTFTYKPDS